MKISDWKLHDMEVEEKQLEGKKDNKVLLHVLKKKKGVKRAEVSKRMGNSWCEITQSCCVFVSKVGHY